MIKLIIFDLDGTLLDTLTDITNSVNYTLNKFNKKPRTEEEIKYFLGQGPRYLLEKSFGEIENYDEVYKVYDAHYKIHQNDNTKPYPGVKETLEELKKTNLKLAVCSNKQDEITKSLIEDLFPGVFSFVIGTSEKFMRKPASDMPNHIMKSLGVTKKETIYVGDTETDMKTAINSNIRAIAVTYGFRRKEELEIFKPYKIISNLKELLEII
ncbi:MAG: HAD family hydrolase [Acholeplasmataceae bacterium]|jgi:phosphoglycolate phosphatase|nr:HAD family hydrolase [Acholeplasmataceae bacterium]